MNMFSRSHPTPCTPPVPLHFSCSTGPHSCPALASPRPVHPLTQTRCTRRLAPHPQVAANSEKSLRCSSFHRKAYGTRPSRAFAHRSQSIVTAALAGGWALSMINTGVLLLGNPGVGTCLTNESVPLSHWKASELRLFCSTSTRGEDPNAVWRKRSSARRTRRTSTVSSWPSAKHAFGAHA